MRRLNLVAGVGVEIISRMVAIITLGFGPFAHAICAPRNSQISDLLKMTEEAANVTKENRRLRRPGDIDKHETAQGRVWCFTDKNPAKTRSWASVEEVESKADYVANSSLFFENDVAGVNRHTFIDRFGARVFKPENCFFEHIQSGEIIRGTNLVSYDFTAIQERADVIRSDSGDIALWRLTKKPDDTNVYPIPREEMIIDEHRASGDLQVVSNYADNAPGGRSKSLTIASCSIGDTVGLPEGNPSRIVFTDCNTGGGSSGSLVYLNEGGQKKVFGMVYGEHTKKTPGSGYDYRKLDTLVVRFGSNLLDLHRDLPKTERQALKGH